MNQLCSFVALAVLVASACRGPSSRVPCRDAAEPVGVSDKVAVPAQGSRKSAEAVDALRKLVAADRLAVEAGELQLAQLKSLAKARRVSDPEMLAAELEVLKLRQKLETRERDLEDAQQDAAADDRPRAGARG